MERKRLTVSTADLAPGEAVEDARAAILAAAGPASAGTLGRRLFRVGVGAGRRAPLDALLLAAGCRRG
jgi:hypothetical protein